jgi:histidine triad (HIT) family protein
VTAPGAGCLFCRIVEAKVPAKAVPIGDPDLEKDIFAFEDIRPQAPTHVLVIPREHVPTVNDLDAAHAALVGRMVLAARSIARARGIAASGYRLVLNTNSAAGQSVYHIHIHLLGGRGMGWPPG